MKKPKKEKRITKVFKRVFNIREMADVDRTKETGNFIIQLLKRFFVPNKSAARGSVQSFDEAVAKMNLSEADLQLRKKSLFRLSILMITISSLILVYSLYNLFLGTWPGFYLSLVVSLLALVLAFRYHFWYFQIKQRKLGCSLQEWFRQGLLGEKV